MHRGWGNPWLDVLSLDCSPWCVLRDQIKEPLVPCRDVNVWITIADGIKWIEGNALVQGIEITSTVALENKLFLLRYLGAEC